MAAPPMMRRPVAIDDPMEVARYAAQMVAKLEEMASSVGLNELAYYLGMARAESDLIVNERKQRNQEQQGEPCGRSEDR